MPKLPDWLWYRLGHGFRTFVCAVFTACLALKRLPDNVDEAGMILCGAGLAFWAGWDSYKQEPK